MENVNFLLCFRHIQHIIMMFPSSQILILHLYTNNVNHLNNLKLVHILSILLYNYINLISINVSYTSFNHWGGLRIKMGILIESAR